jgi:hypothetical protein
MILNKKVRTYGNPCDRKQSDNLPTAQNYYRIDFHIFGPLKKALKCCTFMSDGDMQMAVYSDAGRTKGIICQWETLSNALVGLLSQCL